MKITHPWAALLTIGAIDALRPASTGIQDESYSITPLVNRNGWVNPEDLALMPQCIAQQDQSTWLDAMTRCTNRQCTRHFGVFCTHHQWLTQLSCLSTEFSPDIITQYLPFCSRSILAKAQLFHWIRTITGRTWLVEIGDAYGLQTPSPSSLMRGYTAIGVTDKAPACLTESVIESTTETFRHAMASCGFTSTTQQIGNAARPWEYRESQGTMVALGFETAGYDLTLRSIADGDYFDKVCFCETFTADMKTEHCAVPGLASTKERLWLNATCGPEFMSADWTNGLQTTTFAYIPVENWRLPKRVTAVSPRVPGLVDRCTTDACEPDSDGYCKVKRAVDRACFCQSMSYDDCQGPCRLFETRIDFVEWLHGLCGQIREWHGLPKHWHQVAAPTPTEMIPWQWRVTYSSDRRHTKTSSTRVTTKWKLASVFLINSATLIAGLYAQKYRCYDAYSRGWLVPGYGIAALQLAANWINASLVQLTAGYDNISIIRLALLWCSMPRLTWSIILLATARPFRNTTLFTIASCVCAEVILQALSAVSMMQTISYGLEHDFYSQGMTRLRAEPAAQYMFAGAAIWLLVIVVTSPFLWQAARSLFAQPESELSLVLMRDTAKISPSNSTSTLKDDWLRFEERLASYWLHEKRCEPEEAPLTSADDQPYGGYGTLPPKYTDNCTIVMGSAMVRLTLVAITSMLLLYIAQGIFWVGFIDLSAGDYCPPKLGLLSAIWALASVAGVYIATTPRLE
ncbi:hypothetical protein BKA63DRAFT_506804 [Paraphoma chrysanthemicola]|nr:hypothetical protein BKA63DRAFT_506804 [Paraphoma chrysanthemicola]